MFLFFIVFKKISISTDVSKHSCKRNPSIAVPFRGSRTLGFHASHVNDRAKSMKLRVCYSEHKVSPGEVFNLTSPHLTPAQVLPCVYSMQLQGAWSHAC
jgi:hypothetical protein